MTPDTNAQSGFLGRVPRLVWWVAGGVVAALAISVVVALFVTSSPAFLGRYQAYHSSYTSLQTSGHKGMACSQCHVDARGTVGYRIALVGDFYAGLFRRSDTPVFVKFGPPTRAACLTCHAYDWSMNAKQTGKVPHPAHLRVIDETRDCIVCHRWTAHEETYMQQHKAMPFSTVCASFPCHSGVKPASDCQNCHHQLQQSLGVWRQVHPSVVRANGPNGCLETCHTADQCRTCHTTGKTPVFASTINTSTVSAIEVAHVKSNWLTQHGTFALQDQSKCMTCHVTLAECQDCHSHRPAFHGTDNMAWLGPQGHGKLATDRRRCYTCHQVSECAACHQKFDVKGVTL